MNKTKVCSTCGKRKPLTHYSKHHNTTDGLRCSCRLCLKIAMRNYRKRGSTKTGTFKDATTRQIRTTIEQAEIELNKRGLKLQHYCKKCKGVVK